MSKKILIIGVNGFIGSHLAENILAKTDWQMTTLDLNQDNIEHLIGNPRFDFKQANLFDSMDWIEDQVKAADVVLPLAAIANPATYVKQPLKVFELDFEANLAIIKMCVKHNTRLVFPSTSEVYGMSTDTPFEEHSSNLVTGPIEKERWIYSTSKQLLDRVIYAHGVHSNLQYSLFRPFNWIGPRLDSVFGEDTQHSRVVSRFLSNIIKGDNITLVDGGAQRRCFIYIDDAIDALLRIIENKDGVADGQIFNIGSPENDYSIRELAETLLAQVKAYPKYKDIAEKVELVDQDGSAYYGKGYQDVSTRVPSIKQAQEKLGWAPSTSFPEMLKATCDYYLS